jgi:Raf kinase inhibitor-like YbhB/YbcL family protein
MMLAAITFALASATFKPNTTVPKTMVCTELGGANTSPELHWRGAPKGTKSFALVVHDPDAPHPGGWYHWVVFGLQRWSHELPAGADIPAGALGTTSSGKAGYGGACPPPGKVHHYNFTLYALNEMYAPKNAVTGPQVQAAIKGHVLAKAALTGLYENRE